MQWWFGPKARAWCKLRNYTAAIVLDGVPDWRRAFALTQTTGFETHFGFGVERWTMLPSQILPAGRRSYPLSCGIIIMGARPIATVGWIRIDGHNCRRISGFVMRLDNDFAASLDGVFARFRLKTPMTLANAMLVHTSDSGGDREHGPHDPCIVVGRRHRRDLGWSRCHMGVRRVGPVQFSRSCSQGRQRWAGQAAGCYDARR
jgi:hypothetical protein